MKKHNKPNILLLDIETAPLISYCWGLWDQTIGLNQIKNDWHLLSWSAKWLGSDKIMYEDQRNAKNIEDDSKILKGIWKLLDEADIVIWQNGNNFDHKKLNARFILNGFQPPSTYKKIDTMLIAKKYFQFTSNKLEYLSDKLNKKYKKLTKRKKFSGFELWKECLAGNKDAWNEMKKYNKHDVLALEELYNKLIPWDSSVNFNLYHGSTEHVCTCGSTNFIKNGYAYTASGKFERYKCKSCGSETRSKLNLLSKDKKKSLRSGTQR